MVPLSKDGRSRLSPIVTSDQREADVETEHGQNDELTIGAQLF